MAIVRPGSRSSLSRARTDAREQHGGGGEANSHNNETADGDELPEGDNALAQPSQVSAAGSRPVSRATDRYLDHLGHPLKPSSRQRFRYARTYTIISDIKREETLRAQKRWVLLKDTLILLPHTVRDLGRLFEDFCDAAASKEHSLLTWPAFRDVMIRRLRLVDPVLIKRLFDEFREQQQGSSSGGRGGGGEAEEEEAAEDLRIDFRHFTCALITMNRQPIAERLDLLFDVWDADESGSLSYSELSQHVIRDVPVHRIQASLDAFEVIWRQMRAFSAKADPSSSSSSSTGERADSPKGFGSMLGSIGKKLVSPWQEIPKGKLIEACLSLPAVGHFLMTMLTREAPKADRHARRGGGSLFQARLRELDAEVLLEFKKGEHDDDDEGGEGKGKKPPPTPQDMLKTIRLNHSKSISVMHSPQQKALVAARVAEQQMIPGEQSRPATSGAAPPVGMRMLNSFVGVSVPETAGVKARRERGAKQLTSLPVTPFHGGGRGGAGRRQQRPKVG